MNAMQRRQTKQNYSFEQWLGFLDSAALTLGFQSRMVKQTGAECWREAYDDGYTAMGALLEDLSYACN